MFLPIFKNNNFKNISLLLRLTLFFVFVLCIVVYLSSNILNKNQSFILSLTIIIILGFVLSFFQWLYDIFFIKKVSFLNTIIFVLWFFIFYLFIFINNEFVDICLYGKKISNHNLYIISDALLSYVDSNEEGRFPPHYIRGIDKNGHYPHSWRVHILPYLGYSELFNQIRLNEPWNSNWNSQFHNKMPIIYANPMLNCDYLTQGKTSYCLIVGNDYIYPINGEGPMMTNLPQRCFSNGIRNNKFIRYILVAETTPECWMNPEHDIYYDDAVKGINKTSKGIKNFHYTAYLPLPKRDVSVIMHDGTVTRITYPIEPYRPRINP